MANRCFKLVWLLLLLFAAAFAAHAQTTPVKIAVLPFDSESTRFAAKFADELTANPKIKLLDQDSAQAAARGVINAENNTEKNLFNLSLETAKNLGAAIDCDYFLVIKNANLRRSSFEKPVYFESYALIFLVSARTGRLISWRDQYFEADSTANADKAQFAAVPSLTAQTIDKTFAAMVQERGARATETVNRTLIAESEPDEKGENLRQPLPFRRIAPEYTAAARRHDIEATVDIRVELDERGAVVSTEIVRWAGFDLDESVTKAVQKMQFRPALRDGKPFGIKVLLRYNFREIRNE